MAEWHVSVQFAQECDDAEELAKLINEAGVDAFLDELEGHAASVTGCPEEPNGVVRYGATVSVEADSAGDAGVGGAALVTGAAKTAGLPELSLVKLEVTDDVEMDRELEAPIYPNILGVSELAQMIGVTRQRASELARSSGFAAPFAVLASGPVWLEPNVLRFIKEWERRPGRPRKVAT